MARTGRPTDFNQEVADAICDGIIEGKSLAEICREPNAPSYTSVFAWLRKHEDFAKDYARARESQGDADADKVTDIANRVIAGEIDPAAGRVAIDAHKWTAGKRKPKVYGDKFVHEGSEDNPVRHVIERRIVRSDANT